jgi:hypothetical protein
MNIIFAIVIVVIIVIAFLAIAQYTVNEGRTPKGFLSETCGRIVRKAGTSYDNWFTEPEKIYGKTIGYCYDDNAKMALEKAVKKTRMYKTNGVKGKEKAKDAAVMAFIAGDLYRYNVAPNVDDEHRQRALNGAVELYDMALDLAFENPDIIHTVPIGAMIDRTENFYDEYIPPELPLPDFAQMRDVVRHEKVKGPDYYKPEPIRNDPQNVHDSSVTNTIAERFKTIKELDVENEIDEDAELEAIREEIGKISGERGHRAMKTFIAMNNQGSQVTSLGSNEKEVLLEVWKRIQAPENEKNRESLKAAFIDSLASSIEKDAAGNETSVCTGGRCTRVIDSLTLLDTNKKVAEPPKTKEMFRNEIMTKAADFIKKETEKLDKPLQDAYNGVTTPTDAATLKRVEEFTNNIREKLEKTLRADYKEAPEKIINELIEDAKIGV